MNVREYSKFDGIGLAELVKKKDVTTAELRKCALEAISLINPKLNGIVSVVESVEENVEFTGPFEGVPFLIKELVLHAKNTPYSMGSRLAEGFSLPMDSELMSRFRKTGLNTVGTTTTPEFGYNATTESVLYGPTKNPWNLNHSSGGSSGGSGASVAAGIVPIAHANDGGGSIRIPASCNGLVGLKPSRGRIPFGPNSSEPLNGIAIEFAVTKSVRDTAVLLDAVAGPDVGCYGWAERPSRPFAEQMNERSRPLKIAWMSEPLSGAPVDEECKRELYKTVKLCEELGHELTEDSPTINSEALSLATLRIWAANLHHMINGAAKLLNRRPSPENLEAGIWACYEYGKKITAIELLEAIDINGFTSRAVGEFFTKYDILLSPTLAQKPAQIGVLNANRPGLTAEEWTNQIFTYTPFTSLFNTTGQPSISLPLGWSTDGLPIGMQFTGRLAEEGLLLNLAAQLEEAKPWKDKLPNTHVSKI